MGKDGVENMTVVNWYGLAKSATDPQTIGEFTEEQIAAHQDNPDAHLGVGESLTSHRASVIIDHLAESVVNDKLFRSARRYSAIVDPNSDNDFDTIVSAVEYSAGIGGGDVLIQRGEHHLNGTLYLPPTVSLYGFGIGESVIIQDVAEEAVISSLTDGIAQLAHANNAVAVTGTNIVNMDTPYNPDGLNLVGTLIDFKDGGTTVIRLVTAINSATQYVVDGASLTAGTPVTTAFDIAYTLTNGSSIVTMLSDVTQMSQAVLPGFQFVKSGTGVIGNILTINDDLTFNLSEQYMGATGNYRCYSSITKNITMEIAGLSIDGGESTYIALNESDKVKTTIQNCHFYNYDAPFSSSGAKIHVMNSELEVGGSFELYSSVNALYEGCLFTSIATMQTISINSQDVHLIGCKMVCSSSYSTDYLGFMRGGGRIQDCVIQRQRGITLPVGAGYTSFVLNNIIELYASQALSISTGSLVFTNNVLSGTTSAFTLNASSARHVVLGNQSDGAFTDSGSNNVMANNVTY